MGGLNALLFALTYPEMVDSLIVLDIAPRSYAIHYEAEFTRYLWTSVDMIPVNR